MKQIIKSFIPPIIIEAINTLGRRNIRWTGKYEQWSEASTQARGYNPEIYLNKLIDVTRIVRDDEGKCERDSVLFDKIEYPYPLLSSLFALISYFQAKGLYILDFGGSLGSLYFQNRKFLHMLPKFTWNILEQEKIIEVGKKNFQTHELLFHADFEEARSVLGSQDTKILILSSVLQYLEAPYATLKALIETFEFDAIIIDRTSFSKDGTHRIVLQRVPKGIYDTECPCHLFSKQELMETLMGGGYQLLDEFESYCDVSTPRISFSGFSLCKGG